MKQYKKLEDDYVKQKLLNNELKRQLDDAQADHESEHESNSSKDEEIKQLLSVND